MIKLLIQTFVIFLAFLHQSFAAEVSVEKAARIAKNYYYNHSGIQQFKSPNEIDIHLIKAGMHLNDTCFYIFNVSDSEGFAIISANDAVYPVLAYSTESNFHFSDLPSGLEALLKAYAEQIYLAGQLNLSSDSETAKTWNFYSQSEFKTTPSYDPSEPLLLTKWGQGVPYNEFCPIDVDGPGGRALVGCVAISIAQIMKYYSYPSEGNGSYSYYSNTYGQLSANFGITQYQFDNFPSSSSNSNPNLAQFLYHCGVASRMNYGPDGSGAYVTTACEGMVDYFGYTPNYQYVSRNNYTDNQWISLLKNEIDNLRPMIYVGYDSNSGHAWNCDAYQGNLFHMNWGWNGSYDGFYNISNLTPGSFDFYAGHRVTTNLVPLNSQAGCSSVKTITGAEGSFQDGSAPGFYQPNQHCFFEIIPECGSYISIKPEMMHLGEGDSLIIWNSIDETGEIIGIYKDGSPLDELTSNKGSILVEFITDNQSEGNGWSLAYKVRNCQGTRLHTELNGKVEDGSKDCNYDNARMCYWVIEPPNADTIRIVFEEFDLFNDLDNIKIYEGNIGGDYLYRFNAIDPPTGEIVIAGRKISLQFFTNAHNNAGGWSFDYSSNGQILASEAIESAQLEIYPNPGLNLVKIKFSDSKIWDGNLEVVNQLGSVIKTISNISSLGSGIDLDVSDFPPGVYFIHLHDGNINSTGRFVKL